MALKIGITGGIGSGKSTVCQVFRELGIPVYNADENAKRLMLENTELRTAVIQLLGQEAFGGNGTLNRKWIADLVFSNKELLGKLNSLVHPAVQKDYEAWHLSQEAVSYTLKEAALTFESGGHKFLDKVIVVFAPEDLRVMRVSKRDAVSPSEVLKRITQQMPDHDKMLMADFIIFNDGTHSLIQQVYQLHYKIIRIARLQRKSD